MVFLVPPLPPPVAFTAPVLEALDLPWSLEASGEVVSSRLQLPPWS